MRELLIASLLGGALLLSGCSDSITGNKTETLSVVAGETQTLGSGDTILENREAEIEIIHNINQDTKQVKVLKGSITLVRGNYATN